MQNQHPKKWYIVATEENFNELNAWRKTVAGDFHSRFQIGNPLLSKHLGDDSYYYGASVDRFKSDPDYKEYQEITLEQFRQITGSKSISETTAIQINRNLLNEYYEASTHRQKEYLSEHFKLNGCTTVGAIRGLYNLACDGWKPKIKANHPDCFEPESKEFNFESYVEKNSNILILVPTTSLVSQLYKDFKDYGWDVETHCHMIYSGREKIDSREVYISTWQALYKMPKKYFERFNVIIGDEVHQFKSKSLVSIMTKLCDAKYRYGFTGTLDGIEINKLVLEGLFGPSYKIIRTDELMKKGHVATLDINILLLKHSPNRFETFEDEIQYIINHDRRNKFIKNLALDLKGNTLILFSRVESHGQPLYELINNDRSDDRRVFFVHGGVDMEDREKVREITEKENNAIIVASYGTFSTGINIKNLHNVVFASPSKSKIRNLQSIGRVLRKGDNKNKATLYDIADDISYKSKKNYTLNHLIERIKIYSEENFNYDIVNIPFKD